MIAMLTAARWKFETVTAWSYQSDEFVNVATVGSRLEGRPETVEDAQ